MNKFIAAAFVLLLGACGKEPEPVKPIAGPPKEEPKKLINDPSGKNTCLACKTKTSDDKCPNCSYVFPKAEPVKPKTDTSGTGTGAGKSAISCSYACGNDKCRWTAPDKGGACMDCNTKCEKQVWYVCAACTVEEAVSGNCSKCKATLKKTFK